MGPTLLQRVGVAIDADERRGRRGFEDTAGVTTATEGAIDEDSPMLQRRDEELDDAVGEDGIVRTVVRSVHIVSVPGPALRWPACPGALRRRSP